MSRSEAFAQAKRERMLQAATSGGKFVKVLSTALPKNEENKPATNWSQIRLVGNPADFRGGDPTAAKKFMMAQALADNGKKMNWVFPPKSEDSHWSWRIVNTVLARHWDDTKKQYVYHNTDKAIFSKAIDNGTGNPKQDKGWQPKKLVAHNCIDRNMMAVHRELKKTAALCSSSWEIGQTGEIGYGHGFPEMLYDLIWKIVEAKDDYNDYDIFMQKQPQSPWYAAFHADAAFMAVGAKPLTEYLLAPLTEEELSWERWNFDELYKVTSATKALKRMEKNFNEVDITFRTKFVEELRDLASQEATAALEAAKNGELSASDDDDEDEPSETPARPAVYAVPSQPAPAATTAPVFPTPAAPVAPVVAAAPVAPAPVAPAAPVAAAPAPAAPPVRQRQVAPAAPAAMTPVQQVQAMAASAGWSGVAKLTEQELGWIVGLNPDGTVQWATTDLSGCPECGCAAPTAVHCCPQCGMDF